RNYFRYLPPLGILPLASGPSAGGFDELRFFTGLTYRNPVYVEGAKLQPLVRESRAYGPIDLTSGEMFWLYYVRENRQFPAPGVTAPAPPYVVFVKGHVPYQGNAQFDLAHWDYSNYA